MRTVGIEDLNFIVNLEVKQKNMDAIRQTLAPQNGKLTITLPKEYKQKKFEVIVLPIEEHSEKKSLLEKMNLLISNLPKSNPDITDEDIIAEIKAVRKDRYENSN
jgi:hypothetical protein